MLVNPSFEGPLTSALPNLSIEIPSGTVFWWKVSDPSGWARMSVPLAGADVSVTTVSPGGGSALQLADCPASPASSPATNTGAGMRSAAAPPSGNWTETVCEMPNRLMLAWALICQGAGPV